MKTELLYNLYKKSSGISVDSRTIRKGEMFFALWGNNYNGNHYAAEALKKGASCAVIDDHEFETEKTVLVDDCLFELQALATHHRKELKVPVLAITGSNGKTTTRELIAEVLSKKMKVHSTQGNLNNHIGVPLTILSAPADTELMIIEMGANHIGEIRTLCLIARPDFGLVTNIGTAHIEGFGSFEGVVRAKIEMYEYLRKVNGIAFYNDLNPLLTEKIFRLVNRAVPYSDPIGTSLKMSLVPDEDLITFKAEYLEKRYIIRTKMIGKYNFENIRAAIATGLFFEIDFKDILEAIKYFTLGDNRSEMRTTENNTLICDSYNANPESMRRAVESFLDMQAEDKLLILGDMFELGEKTNEEHFNLLKFLNSKGVTNILLAGPVFKSVCSGFGYKAFETTEELCGHLKKNPVKGFHILIKGSRAMTLEKTYELL